MATRSRRVEAEVREVEIEEGSRKVKGVRATCTECGICVEVFGTGENSRKRALAQLRENCGMGENNFYVEAQ